MSALKSSLFRWRDLLGYSLVGALLAIPIGPIVALAVEGFVEKLFEGTIPNLLLSLGIYLVALGLLWRQSGARIWHFRHLATYSPIFAAVPISLWMIVGFLIVTPPFVNEIPEHALKETAFFVAAKSATIVVIVTGVTTACWSLARTKKRQRSIRERQVTSKDIFSMSLPELFDWLSSETPISRGIQDMFGADERARRVAKALQTERRDVNGRKLRQTVVIQGPFGAGKSSVVNLAEDYICAGSSEHFIFVSVQCWGFSSVAAQEHILEKAISELSREVDCFSLRSIPSAYVDAITETNSWIGSICRVLNPCTSPLDHIRRLTPILEAIGAQLVVIVEDTDRNGPDFDQKHIEAMLYNFREVERVSFILTAGSKSEIEFPKIAEHILFLPALPEDKVLALLDRVRQQCRTGIPFIDPTSGENSSRNRPENLSDSIAGRVASGIFRDEIQPWVRAIATLLNTPRKLKQTLSAVISRWEVLRGEVDVDELIMLTALRICAPGAFTFFGSHFRDFESLFRHRTDKRTPDEVEQRKDRIDFIRSRWNRAVLESDYDSAVLGRIISELIPISASLTGATAWNHGNRCQSIRSKRGDVYWERITAESIPDRELRDQAVLEVLTQTMNDEGIAVLGKRAGESRDFAALVSFFREFSGSIVKDDYLLQAAAVALSYARPFSRAWFSGNPSAYDVIIKWLDVVPFGDHTFRDWVIEQLDACLPHHIKDATFFYSDATRHRLDNESCQYIRKWLGKHCKSIFGNMTVKEFSACFDKDYPYTLGRLIRLDKTKSETLVTRAEDWRWMTPMLLQSMEDLPQIMVPQVMMLFGDYGPGGHMPTYFNFDEDELQSLFGTELPRAVSLLAQPFTTSETMEGWFGLAGPLGTKKAEEWKLRLKAVQEIDI